MRHCNWVSTLDPNISSMMVELVVASTNVVEPDELRMDGNADGTGEDDVTGAVGAGLSMGLISFCRNRRINLNKSCILTANVSSAVGSVASNNPNADANRRIEQQQ